MTQPLQDIEYGKTIIKESYHKNKRTSLEKWYQLPVVVSGKSSTLSEILKAIDLISNHKTTKLILTIEADHSFKFKKVTKEYEVCE